MIVRYYRVSGKLIFVSGIVKTTLLPLQALIASGLMYEVSAFVGGVNRKLEREKKRKKNEAKKKKNEEVK